MLRVIHPLILILLILPHSYSFNFIFIHSRSNSLIPIQTHSYSFKLHSYFSLMFTHTHSYSLKMFTITASPRHARTQSVSHARTHAFALSLTHPLRQCVRSCGGRCLGSLAGIFFLKELILTHPIDVHPLCVRANQQHMGTTWSSGDPRIAPGEKDRRLHSRLG